MTPRRVLVIACGALAREIGAITKGCGLDHIDLACLPASLHNTPDRIPAAVQAAIAIGRKTHTHIFVAYADCGTGGALDRVLHDEGIERLAGPHCYAFYSGVEQFLAAGDADMRSFFLTDFLARQFETLVIRPLGLDRHPELRDAYFGQYEALVYLAQTDDAALNVAATAAASRLGLRYERRFVGYGDLALAVGKQ